MPKTDDGAVARKVIFGKFQFSIVVAGADPEVIARCGVVGVVPAVRYVYVDTDVSSIFCVYRCIMVYGSEGLGQG